MNFIKGRRTYIVAFLMVLIAMINTLSGEMSLQDFLNSEHIRLLLEGAGFWFLRSGVANAKGRTGTKP